MLKQEGSCQVILKDGKQTWRVERNFIFRLNERFRTMFNTKRKHPEQQTGFFCEGGGGDDKRMMESLHFAFVY